MPFRLPRGFLPLIGDTPPQKMPVRVLPRVVTLHIEPEQIGAMMQRCGPAFHNMLGLAVMSGAVSHKVCDIYNVGDDELLVRNYPDEVVPRPLTASVKMLSDHSIRLDIVKDQ